ncbi:hypothetical protein JGI31_001818 [Salmonella enterica]|uniref:Uncharacterized protein n=1 Tax=Salmonella enterica TaxID=28901 RepID=A0A757ZUW5_SALER|nr:hypothetical protein [Salmonella enterica]EFS3277392.1 hypothetical protein [Salmonella enterica]EGW0938329.1 hypothetical protein [Salmonella enterica]HAG0871624.1 hypothetical protein [Salmonella enterica]HAU6833379.1 hypothetical protein [Salmonella enterica]
MFPAPAGINRIFFGNFGHRFSVPRASGDKPKTPGELDELDRVFPAPAGINRAGLPLASCSLGVPRASGDKPEPAMGSNGKTLCSPRQRG